MGGLGWVTSLRSPSIALRLRRASPRVQLLRCGRRRYRVSPPAVPAGPGQAKASGSANRHAQAAWCAESPGTGPDRDLAPLRVCRGTLATPHRSVCGTPRWSAGATPGQESEVRLHRLIRGNGLVVHGGVDVLWPAMTWVICGGRPFMMASVRENPSEVTGRPVQGRRSCRPGQASLGHGGSEQLEEGAVGEAPVLPVDHGAEKASALVPGRSVRSRRR